jgi:hypothetical protein
LPEDFELRKRGSAGKGGQEQKRGSVGQGGQDPPAKRRKEKAILEGNAQVDAVALVDAMKEGDVSTVTRLVSKNPLSCFSSCCLSSCL